MIKFKEIKKVPKLKTHRGMAKRLKRSGTGKLRRFRASKSHLLTKKTRARKRRLKATVTVDAANRKKAERLLPYK